MTRSKMVRTFYPLCEENLKCAQWCLSFLPDLILLFFRRYAPLTTIHTNNIASTDKGGNRESKAHTNKNEADKEHNLPKGNAQKITASTSIAKEPNISWKSSLEPRTQIEFAYTYFKK